MFKRLLLMNAEKVNHACRYLFCILRDMISMILI